MQQEAWEYKYTRGRKLVTITLSHSLSIIEKIQQEATTQWRVIH